MNPNFRWFVEEISKLQKHMIVRCNLTIILANKKYYDLPEFYKQHHVEVVSSLPFYTQDRTDRQRGNGVFKQVKVVLFVFRVGREARPGQMLPAAAPGLVVIFYHKPRSHV